MPRAIFVMGPPGAGKGTQAEFIAKKTGAYHYDTGANVRKRIASGELNPERYDEGKLVTPDIVREMVKKDIKPFVEAGTDIVLSSSPRSVTEAFGSGSQEGLLPFLERAYGKENLLAFVLNITLEEAINRNTKRIGARSDDTPKVIKKRFEEQYGKGVMETINTMREKEYEVIDVDGMPDPDTVFASIKNYLPNGSS